MVFIVYFLQQILKVPVNFFHVNCYSFLLWSKTFKVLFDESMNILHCSGANQVEVFSLIRKCCCSTLALHPLKSSLKSTTASCYKRFHSWVLSLGWFKSWSRLFNSAGVIRWGHVSMEELGSSWVLLWSQCHCCFIFWNNVYLHWWVSLVKLLH